MAGKQAGMTGRQAGAAQGNVLIRFDGFFRVRGSVSPAGDQRAAMQARAD
ncbi:MAG TPA: hypothetical protein VMQ45_00085 [Burkholderiaceae bacterium]|jgi:hypothetical protein|nr:hypothetical protein [Burkholderiaceae bacterium]